MSARRFGVLDIMLFVAATGIGLTLWREYVDKALTDPAPTFPRQPMRWCWYQTMGAAPLLSTWSMALAIGALRRPRPPRGRLFRRPRLVLALLVAVVLLADGLPVAAYLIRERTTDLPADKSLYIFISMPGQVAAALLGLGLVRLLARRGLPRPWPDWQDGIGLGLGIAWVLLGFATNCFRMLV